MKIFEPDPRLAPYVKAFVVVESRDRSVNRLLPGTALVVAIRLKGRVQFKEQAADLPRWSLSGLRKSFRLVEYDSDSANIIIEFKESGAAAFFNIPIYELFESNVSLDHFFRPSELAAMEEQLADAVSLEQQVSVIQTFFIARIRYQKADLLITNAVEKIKAINGILNVKELSDSLYISLDAFEKRFRKAVGATPKQFADIVRMKSLISQVQVTDPLSGPALHAGFFDQSHFIRNFKKFTGLTPKDYFNTTAF